MQVINPMQIAKLSQVPKYLRVATTEEEFREIWKLRQAEFARAYPGLTEFSDDVHDGYACVLYSQNEKGQIVSTGRIAFDGPLGLPADKIIKSEIDRLRNSGLKVAELSKFAISRAGWGVLPYYFYTYYEIAAAYKIDSVIFISRDRYVGVYQKTAGAKILLNDIGYNYGTNFKFSLLECRLSEMTPILLSHWGNNV